MRHAVVGLDGDVVPRADLFSWGEADGISLHDLFCEVLRNCGEGCSCCEGAAGDCGGGGDYSVVLPTDEAGGVVSTICL